MKRGTILFTTLLLLVVVIVAGHTQTVSGQASKPTSSKVFTLKFASIFPPTHRLIPVYSWWLEELGKRSGGRLKIIQYYGGTLCPVPDVWENVLKGVADIGIIGNYTPGKHPVENYLIQSLPFRIPNPPVTSHIYWDLYYKGLLNHEVGEYKFLYHVAVETYAVSTVRKKLTKLEDFKGLRIRVPGVSPTLKALGAETVALPIGEVYTAVERGMVDGLLGGISIVEVTKLEKIIKYINMESFGVGGGYVVMNKDVWKSLPFDLQLVIETLSPEVSLRHMETVHNYWGEILSNLKAAGAEAYYVDPKELERWKNLTANLFTDWIAEMEAKGLRGNQIKQETLRVLREHGVDPGIR
jgi:TRAP-type C4-dicarboxylate transport system substrate-binding protein